MKFFLPDVKSDTEAEQIYTDIKSLVKSTSGFEATDRRIYRIKYSYRDKIHEDIVGQFHFKKSMKELVVAILESNAYLICTPSRSGWPFIVGQEDIISIEDFEI